MNNLKLCTGMLVGTILTLGIVMGGGCVPQDRSVQPTPSVPQLTPSLTTSPVWSPTSVGQLLATPTQPPATASTPIPGPIVTPTAQITARPTCPPRETALPPTLLTSGTIILVDESGYMLTGYDHFYSLSLPGLSLRPFLQDLPQGIGQLNVSPDGKLLALSYERLNGQQVIGDDLIVASTSKSSDRTVMPWDETNWSTSLLGWLADSRRLVIIPSTESRPGRRDDIITFDVVSRKQQRITPLFPTPQDLYPEYLRKVDRTAIYDPSLSRVAYFLDKDTLVLWDLQHSRELGRLVAPDLIAFAARPKWAPDGHALALAELTGAYSGIPNSANGFRIVFLGRDGALSETEPFPYYFGLAAGFDWSPDSRYLDFSWADSQGTEHRLLLLDTRTEQVLDYCIVGTVGGAWSPDSRQMILQVQEPISSGSGNKGPQDIIVDLDEGRVFQFQTTSLAPLVWLRTTP